MSAYPAAVPRDSADLTVYLIPAGHGRVELYSEAPEEVDETPPADGRARRWVHHAGVRWRELVDAARRGSATSRFAQWRDRIVCHLAESIAEQRTLWALRETAAAIVAFSSTTTDATAGASLNRLLADARRHHGRWLAIDIVLMAITGPLFFFVPGPNVISWYFLFRVIGHLLSWRGARRAMDRIRWTYQPDHRLAELARLVDVPRAARAQRVEAIAATLNLPRLSAFFDRVAVPD
jgi:hypothetical protein